MHLPFLVVVSVMVPVSGTFSALQPPFSQTSPRLGQCKVETSVLQELSSSSSQVASLLSFWPTYKGVLVSRPFIAVSVTWAGGLSHCCAVIKINFFRVSSSPESSEKSGWGLWGYINAINLWFVWKEKPIAYKLPVLILAWITKTPVLILPIASEKEEAVGERRYLVGPKG